MEQDISVRLMMLTIKYEEQIPPEYQGFVRKYLALMHVVGFDCGCNYVYARYSNRATAVIQYDKNYNRIAEYPTVAKAVKVTGVSHDTIFRALKTHKLTKKGQYWTRVS